MEIVNRTPYIAGWTSGFSPDGRELAVVVVKATYALRPTKTGELRLADRQAELLEADEFGDDPARGAPRAENDFAPYKPRCDVLGRVVAQTPGGAKVRRLEVGFCVGPVRKLFVVVGPRVWMQTPLGITASEPLEFTRRSISYDVAFGGTETDPDCPQCIKTFLSNPCGTGFAPFSKTLDGKHLPATEELGSPVTSPTGNYRPRALGPLGRNWDPRFRYAGTYDERWLAERVPFLPEDFDARYFQAAAADQQMEYPRGGEPILLVNLACEPRLESRIPHEKVFVTFIRRNGGAEALAALLDTVVIDPEEDRLFLTWRATVRLRRDIFELREMLVERGSDRTPAQARARTQGKPYYASLAELPRRRRR